ncbi:predicted protein [Brucella abortus bv. 4 str. 292]|uniref:Uncharacterized protein n=6 Tax=Brucella TaxID=234 RepID=Q57CF6_BRUAB|nr:hypothetical protein BR1348 [Brucella suis 1330]AAX74678.1 hypothetical protein BruAb1_1346 [Brucella abortus bv. 1 str. 9-941]ABX62411.1 Hypothetical protein, conserved [Brucella canis ATCC 23365]ABY38441.1 Hypothetical protein, conserved [Brucella suis ATCC 23445]ACO01112.1 Hypothetical protein, conserved [Brucella melitensis ATCC 23457]ACU48327.1 hypothetical protein BMI_I1359 [Brucella microti CCM 4915]AEK54658.1 hypothetical protein BPI_I1399 [Brucella pinnipedialis B2/94]AEU06347.1 
MSSRSIARFGAVANPQSYCYRNFQETVPPLRRMKREHGEAIGLKPRLPPQL